MLESKCTESIWTLAAMLTSPATTNWFHVVETVGFCASAKLSCVWGCTWLSNLAVKMRGGHSAFKKTLGGHSEIAVFSLTCLLFFKLCVIAPGFFNYLFSDSWDPIPESCRAPRVTCPSVCVCLAKHGGFLQQVSGNVGTVQLTPLKEYIAKVLPWWVILAVLVSHVNVNLYLV